eukprot:14958836-Alexandrium_andersonii.AAC.1
MPFELEMDPINCNFMTSLGNAHVVSLACAVRPGGISANAPVCSTWALASGRCVDQCRCEACH